MLRESVLQRLFLGHIDNEGAPKALSGLETGEVLACGSARIMNSFPNTGGLFATNQ